MANAERTSRRRARLAGGVRLSVGDFLRVPAGFACRRRARRVGWCPTKSMNIKRESAFHAAGHTIAAHRSRFHNVVGSINLADRCLGASHIGPSATKLAASGQASAERDKEVAVDLAVILSAGLVAEQLAGDLEQGISADPSYSDPDHELMRQRLAGAGLSRRFDRHEATARQLLEAEWDLVCRLAAYLLENVYVDAYAIEVFIGRCSQDAGDAGDAGDSPDHTDAQSTIDKIKNWLHNKQLIATRDSDYRYNLSSAIAYAGHFGSMRKDWCEVYITWKTELFNAIQEAHNRAERERNIRITCSRGCWFCCTHFIEVSLQECEGIVYWLNQHQGVRSEFIERYAIWQAKVSDHEPLFQQVCQKLTEAREHPVNPVFIKALAQTADAFNSLGITCPFLVNEECSIYPVRPVVCAEYATVSPVSYCKPNSTAICTMVKSGITPIEPQYFCISQSGQEVFSMPKLVDELLRGGFSYLSNILNRSELELEASSDPDVLAVQHSFLESSINP